MRSFRKRRPAAAETLTMERDLPAPPGPVFAAFTDAAALMRWMRPFDTDVTAAEVDFETGDWYRLELAGRRGRWTIGGKYLQVEPPRLLAFTWASPITFEQPTIVTLRMAGLGATARETRLTLVHERLPGRLAVERHEAMWTDVLARLAGDLVAAAGRTAPR